MDGRVEYKTSEKAAAIMILAASVAFAAWVFSPPDVGAIEIERNSSDQISDADVHRALKEFIGACRPGSYWNDLTDIKASISIEFSPHRLAKGWKTTIHLSAKVPEKPERIPAAVSGGPVMSGQTLHYDIGGGTSPGFFAGKRAAKWLCSMHESLGNSNDAFVAVPALSFLP